MGKVIPLEELAKYLKILKHKNIVISISGFGGSRKSTTVEKLAQLLETATVIHLDDFMVDRLSKRSSDWEGFDYNRLVDEVVKPIKQGKTEIEHGLYYWKKNVIIENKKFL